MQHQCQQSVAVESYSQEVLERLPSNKVESCAVMTRVPILKPEDANTKIDLRPFAYQQVFPSKKTTLTRKRLVTNEIESVTERTCLTSVITLPRDVGISVLLYLSEGKDPCESRTYTCLFGIEASHPRNQSLGVRAVFLLCLQFHI